MTTDNLSQDSTPVFNEPTETNISSSQVQGQDTDGTSVQEGTEFLQQDDELSQAKDWEHVSRIWQSRYDKAQAELKKINDHKAQLSSKAELLDEVINNPDVRRAFLSELEPDLVQQIDIDSLVERKLKAEFGEDFEPDPEEARSKGYGKSFRYFEKAKKLYQELENQSTKASSLKELREQQAREREELQKRMLAKTNNDVGTVQRVMEFYQKLTPEQAVDYYNLIVRNASQQQKTTPSTTSVKGNPVQQSSRQQFLQGLKNAR